MSQPEGYVHLRRVVCAALRAKDGSVLLGIRHYSMDMHEQIDSRVDGSKWENGWSVEEGFADQWGVFMDRKEAYTVAVAANQIIRPWACENETLYSEGLY